MKNIYLTSSKQELTLTLEEAKQYKKIDNSLKLLRAVDVVEKKTVIREVKEVKETRKEEEK